MAWPEWKGIGWAERREVKEGRIDGERDGTGKIKRNGTEKGGGRKKAKEEFKHGYIH